MYDLIIIGGGAAGVFAAAKAAKAGLKVTIVEKNACLGKKLLITGNGRCNLTNTSNNLEQLVNKFGKNGKFLFSVFNFFGLEKTIDFFNSNKIETYADGLGKIFPITNQASDVIDMFYRLLKKEEVNVFFNTKVNGLKVDGNKVESINTSKGIFAAKYFILATGGKSYPKTGSTGDGYKLAKKIGHTIEPTFPALVPIILKGIEFKKLAGIALEKVAFYIYQNSKKVLTLRGDVLFTHEGLSGPAIIDASSSIRRFLINSEVEIVFDFFPDLNEVELENKFKYDFNERGMKQIKTILESYANKKIIHLILNRVQVSHDKQCAIISKKERKQILRELKCCKFKVRSLDTFEKAFITEGGVALQEIDSKSMCSKFAENFFFAGEVIDLTGPTGGYNLQLAWSTAALASESIVRKMITA